MSKVAEPWSARQQRQLAYISEYTTDIRHIAGKSNVVADCLSRAVVGAIHLGLDYVHMSADQASDHGVQSLQRQIPVCAWRRSRLAARARGYGATFPQVSLVLLSLRNGTGLFLRRYMDFPTPAESRP